MANNPLFNGIESAFSQLGKQGIFLTAGDPSNTMTISWGSLGVFWGKPVAIVPVRPSRFTDGLLSQSGEFTLSIPTPGQMSRELAFCGSRSGRDTDKYAELGLSRLPARQVKTSVIVGCQRILECRVVYSQALDESALPEEIIQGAYPRGDFHTLYYGEILENYTL